MIRRTLKLLGLVLALALLGRGRAFAASSATVDIEITINASLSVKVDSLASSTYTAVWNAATPNAVLVSGSTATVTNDSGGLTEKWGLSTLANTIDQGTGGSWSLQTNLSSVGPDQFGLQAVFGSSDTVSCPAAGAADWSAGFAPALQSAAPVAYTSTTFADTNLNAGGSGSLLLYDPDIASGPHDGRMHAGSKRALCWRAIMPSSTSTVDPQAIQIIVTALDP